MVFLLGVFIDLQVMPEVQVLILVVRLQIVISYFDLIFLLGCFRFLDLGIGVPCFLILFLTVVGINRHSLLFRFDYGILAFISIAHIC